MGLTSARHGAGKKTGPAVATARTSRTRTRSAPQTEPKASNNGSAAAPPGAETVARSPRSALRDQVFDELESALDHVLYRAIGIGDMTDVERLIRQCRRLVILERGPQL
jgi:hypothetical protein